LVAQRPLNTALETLINLPPQIESRVSRCVAGVEGPNFAIDAEARDHGCIALIGTIGMIWGIRPDGSFWQFDEDSGRELASLPEEHELEALVFGVRRHPWLEELLPVRPTGAVGCARCEGSGSLGEVSLCPDCRGLGWRV
jgi:hypothetical protein